MYNSLRKYKYLMHPIYTEVAKRGGQTEGQNSSPHEKASAVFVGFDER